MTPEFHLNHTTGSGFGPLPITFDPAVFTRVSLRRPLPINLTVDEIRDLVSEVVG